MLFRVLKASSKVLYFLREKIPLAFYCLSKACFKSLKSKIKNICLGFLLSVSYVISYSWNSLCIFSHNNKEDGFIFFRLSDACYVHSINYLCWAAGMWKIAYNVKNCQQRQELQEISFFHSCKNCANYLLTRFLTLNLAVWEMTQMRVRMNSQLSSTLAFSMELKKKFKLHTIY